MIYNDDCFNVFPRLETKSVDLVLVDLPYGQTACVWDTCIDLNKMWVELERIGTDRCWFVFFCTTKFGHTIISSKEKWFRYDLVLQKTNNVGFLNINTQPLRNHEMIYVFRNPKFHKPTYHPWKEYGHPPYTRKQKDNVPLNCVYRTTESQGLQKVETVNDGYRYGNSVIKTKIGNHHSSHPTQKPLDVLERLISMYSNENNVVLDFTAGSGSTAIACINTNRRYICIEMDPKFYDIMYRRIYIKTIELD